jgi:hypothetical protein
MNLNSETKQRCILMDKIKQVAGVKVLGVSVATIALLYLAYKAGQRYG